MFSLLAVISIPARTTATAAWEMMPLAIDTPPQHPQQDPGILMGAIPAVAPNVVAGANLVADLIAE